MNTFRTRVGQLLVLLALVWAAAIGAAEPVRWADLGNEEKRVLAAHADTWERLDALTQERLVRGARRWLMLTPEQRTASATRFAEWQGLPPDRRQEIRRRYEAFQGLPPDKRHELKRVFNRFRFLPPQERAELRRRFEAMSPEERRGFLTGMHATQRADRARQIMQRLPEPERAATRVMFESFTPEQRHAMRSHMLALPPRQRDDLRRKLLAMSANERSVFLATPAGEPFRPRRP